MDIPNQETNSDFVCLSLSPLPQTLTGDSRRARTPAPESAQEKKITLVLRTASIPREGCILEADPLVFPLPAKLFPTGKARVEKCLVIPAKRTRLPPWHLGFINSNPSRQIILPFDLREGRSALSDKSNENLLWAIFPGTVGFMYGTHSIGFLSKTHLPPPLPLPQEGAGLACYITDNWNKSGPEAPIYRIGRLRIELAPGSVYQHGEGDIGSICNKLRLWFANAEIPITELQCWDHLVVIVLENPTDLASVPYKIGGCGCFYMNEEELCQPRELFSAFGIRSPIPGQSDNAEYAVLRPGVMLSSGQTSELFVSSGVLVQDRTGARYMTISSNGFPPGTTVYQPNIDGHRVGEVTAYVPNTALALVKLDNGIEFTNELFQNTVIPGLPTRLPNLAGGNAISANSDIFPDTPFSGYMEGQ